MLDREIPGIAEALRLGARERVPTSVLSRGLAGSIGEALVVTLPGSPGGVRDGFACLRHCSRTPSTSSVAVIIGRSRRPRLDTLRSVNAGAKAHLRFGDHDDRKDVPR